MNKSVSKRDLRPGYVATDMDISLDDPDAMLRVAANSIPIGFVMFDASKRIVVANTTFLTMYDLSAEKIRPGTTLIDLLRERFRGTDTSEEELEEKVAFIANLVDRGESHNRVDRLPNGRRISIGHRPLPGGGWVGTHEDVTDREAAAEKLRYLAHHDVLTGVKSRAFFWEALQGCIEASESEHAEFALHMIDLDRFKAVNDTLGHEAGDIVLQRVASRLQKIVRRVDIIARLGGDEFAIVQRQPGINHADAQALATRVVEAISGPIDVYDEAVEIGASLGIALVTDFDEGATQIINAADQAMYEAKAAGRNGYVLADPATFKPKQDASRRLSI